MVKQRLQGLKALRRLANTCWRGPERHETTNAGWHWLHNQADNHGSAPAFVFDIDGVLLRGQTVIPSAREALRRLWCPQGTKARYPVCFLTNGGGVTEQAKAKELSDKLDVVVTADQVVLSHTPFRQLAQGQLGQQPVLVVGRKQSPGVAREYGFQHIATPEQLAEALPHAVPFANIAGRDARQTSWASSGLPGLSPDRALQAILVFTDPIDWYINLQLCLDVLTSGGVLGRRAPPQGSNPVQLYFSNPDLLFANEFSAPRLGQGAFAAALQELHVRVTGRPPDHVNFYGKPNPEPYQLALRLLTTQMQQAVTGRASERATVIYAVGDNPAADIRGARLAGSPFCPVLVRTGVFEGQRQDADVPDAERAKYIVDDVGQAVDLALHAARHAKWHAMR